MNNTLTVNGRLIDDHIVGKVRSDLATSYYRDGLKDGGTHPLEFTAGNVAQWLSEACRQTGQSYHPVQDWLRGLPRWDGHHRVERLLETCFALEPDQEEIARLASRDLVLGLVCRAMEPGKAWPRMVCLYGPEGIGKSLLLKLLVSERWFVECNVYPPKPEELYDQCKDGWAVEFGDTANNSRWSASNRAKMLLSATSYTYRHRYDRAATVHPYGFVFVLTANEGAASALPADESGLRRYLVVEVGRKVTNVSEYLTTWFSLNRDQVFAEALAWFDNDQRFTELSDEQRVMQTGAAEAHTDTAFWDGLAAYLPTYAASLILSQTGPAPKDISRGFRLDEIVSAWLAPIDFGPPSPDKVASLIAKQSAQLGTTMKQSGWVKRQIRVGGGKRQVRWWPPEDKA